MGEAIFGLMGVIVGGLLTAGIESKRERRREKRAKDLAKKLLLSELLQVRIFLDSIAKLSQWPPIEDVDSFVPTKVWTAETSVLIGQFDEGMWRRLISCYGMIAIQRAQVGHPLNMESARTITPDHVTNLVD